MFQMVYVFIATQFVDVLMKFVPPLITHFTINYKKGFENLENKMLHSATDILDNKVKKKKAAI